VKSGARYKKERRRPFPNETCNQERTSVIFAQMNNVTGSEGLPTTFLLLCHQEYDIHLVTYALAGLTWAGGPDLLQ
jgi:hypothetical protein